MDNLSIIPVTDLKHTKSILPWRNRRRAREEEMAQSARRIRQLEGEKLRREQQDRLDAIAADEKKRMDAIAAEERKRIAEEKKRKALQTRIEIERKMELHYRRNSPEALRNLRGLIRARYELDMEIYRNRTVSVSDRKYVLAAMERSDAILLEIRRIVGTWQYNSNDWTHKEWDLAKNVRDRIYKDNKRFWGNSPPWDENAPSYGSV